MSQRQEKLTALLNKRFGIGKSHTTSIEWTDLKKMGLANEVKRTYMRLGGILPEPPLSFGKWDISIDGFLVELDEEQHFNRYRASTFDSFIYHCENGFDSSVYSKYCAKYEIACIKKASWGKYWTSPSTERQFGSPGINGNLDGKGSPRWRQRAYYDYLRDVFALIKRIPVIRISVYDQIIVNGKICTAGNILSGSSQSELNEIVKFIERKVDRIL